MGQAVDTINSEQLDRKNGLIIIGRKHDSEANKKNISAAGAKRGTGALRSSILLFVHDNFYTLTNRRSSTSDNGVTARFRFISHFGDNGYDSYRFRTIRYRREQFPILASGQPVALSIHEAFRLPDVHRRLRHSTSGFVLYALSATPARTFLAKKSVGGLAMAELRLLWSL